MDIQASSQYIRISPRKMRLVVEAIKPLSVVHALAQLRVMEKQAAYYVDKTLRSCIANAVNNAKAKEEDLTIKTITVDEGPAFKRWQPVSRGMAHPYKKRTSHITITLTVQPKIEKKSAPPTREETKAVTAKAKKETMNTEDKTVKKPEKKIVKKGVTRGTKNKS